MPFVNNNVARGLRPNSPFQVGRSNIDNNVVAERGIPLPWSSDPQGSYVYYDCTIGVLLDSGIVVHNRLPQVNYPPDSLSAVEFRDPAFDRMTQFGVSLRSLDQYQDIAQRMGHSRYWFRLWGQALRVGYKVPIPGLLTIGGVAVVPHDKNPQWAYNRIFPGGNYSGAILWHAQWSLWYTTTFPPINDVIPVIDPAAHINADVPPPSGMQSPYTIADDNAFTTGGPRPNTGSFTTPNQR